MSSMSSYSIDNFYVVILFEKFVNSSMYSSFLKIFRVTPLSVLKYIVFTSLVFCFHLTRLEFIRESWESESYV